MNAALALHALLERVHSSEANLQNAWGDALDCAYGDQEFVRRFAEVFNLLGEALKAADTLPETQASRYRQHAGDWWSAIVMPQNQWSATTGGSIMNPLVLSQLGSLGDLLEAKYPGTATSPDGADNALVSLRQSIVDVLASLESHPLPASVAREIDAQLRHVLWLVDNADKFGSGRVAAEAERGTGAVVIATGRIQDVEKQRAWAQKATALIVSTSLYVSAVAVPMAVAIEGTNRVLDGINHAENTVADILDGPEHPAVLDHEPHTAHERQEGTQQLTRPE